MIVLTIRYVACAATSVIVSSASPAEAFREAETDIIVTLGEVRRAAVETAEGLCPAELHAVRSAQGRLSVWSDEPLALDQEVWPGPDFESEHKGLVAARVLALPALVDIGTIIEREPHWPTADDTRTRVQHLSGQLNQELRAGVDLADCLAPEAQKGAASMAERYNCALSIAEDFLHMLEDEAEPQAQYETMQDLRVAFYSDCERTRQ
ncbi:MAG: hypothetical protein AAGA38_01805 [Pseudomonadota bacterium]